MKTLTTLLVLSLSALSFVHCIKLNQAGHPPPISLSRRAALADPYAYAHAYADAYADAYAEVEQYAEGLLRRGSKSPTPAWVPPKVDITGKVIKDTFKCNVKKETCSGQIITA